MDETNRHYFKYFDAVGRLVRETKFVNEEIPDTDPYNPDSVYAQSYTPPSDLALNTDYRYDSLYRVNCVQTPAYKRIWYNYDNKGRQIKRITPDAGTTEYGYDINNNLLTSQDAKQKAIAGDMFTYRSYDGLNRLISISESQPTIFPEFAEAINSDNELDFTAVNTDLLTVNVYDELIQNSSNPFYDIFSNTPSDYFSVNNNSKGALVCTAFRTRKTDDWNYKYYRYDARGRVVVQWTYLDELGWKRENYTYNSQNQITSTQYQPNAGDAKSFANSYDLLGRLNGVSTYSGSNPIGQDNQNTSPQTFEGLAGYTYNPNSQILTSSLKSGMPVSNYFSTNRNWVSVIRSSNSGGDFFVEGMDYNANGNIGYQTTLGSYKDNFSNPDDLQYHYVYDKSNRLLQADALERGVTENNFDLSNTYDHDGNITKLIRYEDDKNPSDNFNYIYQTGTNKLLKVRGESTNDYSYDENGNLLHDDVNEVWDMKYDFRNLLLSCTASQPDFDKPDDHTSIYHTEYFYDEAGNRVNKTSWKYSGTDNQPHYPTGTWNFASAQFYVRNISGAEVAVYAGYDDLTFWNIWGSDNVGRIKGNGDKEFYIKDHLGSIRCVVDASSNILSSQDFDAWGHKISGRKYVGDKPSKYQFTGKERDLESDYDYFGARYYDSRVARWGQVDPLADKHRDFSPYNYVLNNSLSFVDPDGEQVHFDKKFVQSENFTKLITEIREISGIGVYVNEEGFLQMGNIGIGAPEAQEFVLELLSVEKYSLNVWSNENLGSYGLKGAINLNPTQMNEFESGVHNLDYRTMGWAMDLFHEFLHTTAGGALRHKKGERFLDPIDAILIRMNKLRKQLDNLGIGGPWGEEQSHIALDMGMQSPLYYHAMSTTAKTMMALSHRPDTGDEYIITYTNFEGK